MDSATAGAFVAEHSATSARALDHMDLPNIGELVAANGPKIAKYTKPLAPVAAVAGAFGFASDMAACYDTPQ